MIRENRSKGDKFVKVKKAPEIRELASNRCEPASKWYASCDQNPKPAITAKDCFHQMTDTNRSLYEIAGFCDRSLATLKMFTVQSG